MKIKQLTSLLLFLILVSCQTQTEKEIYKSENLVIQQVTENIFIHISYLQTQDFGKVACNGMLFIKDDEAMVFDTPTDNTTSEELIDWLQNNKKVDIKGVVVTHFHIDCIGGLNEFHKNNIESYASEKTIALLKDKSAELPQVTLDLQKKLVLKGEIIRNSYFGEGHTKDNIVSYIPSEKVLFGGCLIKSIGAKKGNLEDANTADWSTTVLKIIKELPTIEHVIPGHGKAGGTELLSYTVELFNKE
ncbi:subclass B1 metallo-beta-lactamase [Aureibaculum flavum]|uniref:subclass B1 metallo-beta-lactamase n=1 Tax=Aureibaculum flavum TaxID=2795986 RepID=UPI001E5B7202|nr:subclass B1 metallo-beta-lactamase [Aureibaculum flavum]